MSKKILIGAAVLILGGIALSQALFVVDEREQALVLQFGEFQRQVQEPGLSMKVPFIQNVVYYEKRILNVDPPREQVILADQRRLDVDTFARYRIAEARRFFQTVQNESGARERLSRFINSVTRSELGQVTQLEVLSEARADIMNDIRDQVSAQAAPLGIDVIDVRIGRADVPEGTLQSVYDRMRSEREREAAEFRAQGQEQAQQIRARADRERTVLLAEAEREAQILRGEGDAQAISVLAESFGQDEEFFRFYRTLQAYRESLRDEDTTLVLAPTGEFFKFFHSMNGGTLPVDAEPRVGDQVRGGPTGTGVPEGSGASLSPSPVSPSVEAAEDRAEARLPGLEPNPIP